MSTPRLLSVSSLFRRSRRGFALLATIVLVAFLVLLLVGLATFTRVETKVSGNSQTMATARQNALTGLNLALGQLQRYAGSDRQNTARSDITGVSAPNQLYFTGTWEGGTLTSWLVSGNENDPTGTGAGIDPTEALDASSGAFPVDDATNQVYLLGANSVTANADGVLLAKQVITAPAGSVPGFTTAQTIGHYAWWVGDEGIKASASLIDPLLDADPATNDPISYDNSASPDGDDWSDASKQERLNQLQLARPRLEKVLTSVDPDLAANVISQRRVESRSQLRLLNGSPTDVQLKARYHDLTPLSRGVLADTANGTLRVDLSGSTGTASPISSYQLLRPVTVPATVPAGVEAEFFPIAPSSAAGTWPTYGVVPVLSEAGVRFKFNVATAGTLTMQIFLDAEVWNPYAATLKTDATHTLRFRVTIPNQLRFRVTDSASATQDITLPAGTIYTADIDTAVVWSPGQVISLARVAGGNLGTGAVEAATSDTPTTIADAANVESLDAVANLKFELILDTGTDAVLQDITLSGTTFAIAGPTTAGGPSGGLGYGYEFNRDLRRWTSDPTPVTDPDFHDPRAPVLNGGFSEPDATSQWRDDAASNTNGISGTGHLTNNARVVLFDLPRQELISLAQLRHLIGAKSYALGSPWGGPVNDRFDANFVSTVPRNFNWPPDGSQPRPNRYLEIYAPDQAPAGEFDTNANKLASLRSSANSARYQLIRGAFNINSTSVGAWTAVLGAKLTGWDHSGVAGAGVNLNNAFFRTDHGAQQRTSLSGTIPPVPTITDIATLTDSQLLGATGRQLLDSEVVDLATEIVRLLKNAPYREPFESLEAFVNSGLIQTAIANVNLNSTLGSSGSGNAELSYSAPAITQADVIACIAPFMAARSDTFVIRSYGDVANPATGLVEGRAWCEATVQRVPDLVSDPAAPVATVINPPALGNPFGRRFKIISFRWLSPDDL